MGPAIAVKEVNTSLLQSELGEFDNLSTLRRALVGTDTNAGPVGTRHRIGPRIAVLDQRGNKLVHQVRMGTAMTTPLDKGKVIRILNRLGKLSNFYWQKMGIVGDFDLRRDFMLGFLGGMNHVRFVFNQRPLKALLGTVDIETLSILSRGIKKESPNMGRDVAILYLDMARFDGETIAGFLHEIVANLARPKTRNILRQSFHQTQYRGNNVRRIVHWDHSFPILWPSIHVLWMASSHVLNITELSSLVHFFDEQKP